MTSNLPPYFSPKTAAKALESSRKYIYELIKSGKLKAIRVSVSGKHYLIRIKREDFEEFLASNVL